MSHFQLVDKDKDSDVQWSCFEVKVFVLKPLSIYLLKKCL